MAIKRLWFPNSPAGSIDSLQRFQLGIHWPFVNTPAPPPPNPIIPLVYTKYIRSYLGDNDNPLDDIDINNHIDPVITDNWDELEDIDGLTNIDDLES